MIQGEYSYKTTKWAEKPLRCVIDDLLVILIIIYQHSF